MLAGWSKLDCDSSMQRCKNLRKVDSNDCLGSEKSKLHSAFVELVSVFIKGTCPSDSFRPLPPMLGNGHFVDLRKLYFVVKQKGGFDVISKNGLWDEVGLIYGLGPGFGSAIKLVYLKYLESLESWLVKLCKSKKSMTTLMELETDYNSFVSKISDEMRKNDDCYILKVEKSDISFVDFTNVDNGNEMFKRKKIEMTFADVVDLTQEIEDNLKFKRKKIEMGFANDVELIGENNDKMENYDDGGLEGSKSEMSSGDSNSPDVLDAGRSSVSPEVADNVVKSSEDSSTSKECLAEPAKEFMHVDSSMFKEEVSIHERKNDCLSKILCWMANVAKDPTDPVIGTIPESSRWALSGNDNFWKQVLLAREALFLKRDQVSSTEQSIWQRKQKMHPSMFDDQSEAAERPRASPRLLNANMPNASFHSICTPNEAVANRGRPRQRFEARLDLQPRASIYTSRPQQRIPVGQPFQAQVLEWTGVPTESDSKWLGTQVWPLGKRQKPNLFVERDPIGKGRVDGCSCQFPGSTVCVKFHVSERRSKMKGELGSAFYAWEFGKMGEEFSVLWSAEEEKKFKSVVMENPASLLKYFWPQMLKVLPRKSWVDLVNYYFNVFMLRRRGSQNRLSLSNIDSDDDETEYTR